MTGFINATWELVCR